MNRVEFIKKVIRFLLFGMLAVAALIAGRSALTGNNCSSCPGKGICSGGSECSTFLSEKR